MRDVLMVLAWWIWAGWGVGLALHLLKCCRKDESEED